MENRRSYQNADTFEEFVDINEGDLYMNYTGCCYSTALFIEEKDYEEFCEREWNNSITLAEAT